MEIVLFLKFIIIGVVIYSGLIVGKMLAMIAPEELKPGRDYLILFQRVLFFTFNEIH